MNKPSAGGSTGTTIPGRMRSPATFGLADWLCLAAAPTFAVMALMTALTDRPDMVCSMGQGPLALGGMAPMYLLMCAFHLTPWLRLWR